MDCGESFPTYVMDFDHRPGERKVGIISDLMQGPLDRLFTEMAKCDVVCANCHAVRSAQRHEQKVTPNWKRGQRSQDVTPAYARYRDTHMASSKRRNQQRKNLFDSLRSLPCLDCLRRFPSEVMEFDHRDPALKIAPLSKLLFGRLDVFFAELQKCDLVCRNCHRVRTFGRARAWK